MADFIEGRKILSVNSTTKEDAIRLLSGGYGRAFMKLSAAYVTPLFWVDDRIYRKPKILSNGTMFFLECGEGVFAVTAVHVLHKYLYDKEKIDRVYCQIGNMRLSLESRLIARDAHLDIATFRFTTEEIESLGKRVLCSSRTTWPPLPPEAGKGVFFAGFPGVERYERVPYEVSFGVYHVSTIASNVNERDVVCRFEREHWVAINGNGLPSEGYNLGGISGAPLLTLVERQGLVSWMVGGVIYEATTGIDIPGLEIVRARRADFICPDGQLNHNL